MTDLGSSLGNAGFVDFDYTFTDKELQDVLGYMERQQSGNLDPLPFLNPTALQFQPHVTSPDANQPSTSGLDFAGSIKPEVFDLMDFGGLSVSVPHVASAPLVTGTQQQPQQSLNLQSVGASGTSSSHGGNGGVSSSLGVCPSPSPAVQIPVSELASASVTHPSLMQQQQSTQQAQQLTQGQTTSASLLRQQQQQQLAARKDGKPHISHSTVEKQRRDRINSLIDELRELVPPSRQDVAALQLMTDQHDVKRPKHVVLSDTIAMVKELQERLNISESRIARLREHEEHCPFHDHEQHQVALRAENNINFTSSLQNEVAYTSARDNTSGGSIGGQRENSSGSRDSHPELPHAPEGTHAPEEPAVCVEDGDGCMYVKVSCKDRHGLLSDIVRALKAISVEIITAAITTTKDGGVYDVFQVTPEDGTTVSQEDVMLCVQGVLEAQHTGDKRRRDS